METCPVKESCHGLIAFEIDMAYITIGKIVELLNADSNISNVRRRKLFTANSDVHVSFQYRGVPFIVWEPFGDNSRFWIGPEDPDTAKIDATPLKAVFDRYSPGPVRQLFGDLITLRFLKKSPRK